MENVIKFVDNIVTGIKLNRLGFSAQVVQLVQGKRKNSDNLSKY